MVRAFGGGFDEFPEFRILLKRLVFGNREVRAIEEIFERVFVHDAIDQHAEFVSLEINSIIAEAKAMEIASGAMDNLIPALGIYLSVIIRIRELLWVAIGLLLVAPVAAMDGGLAEEER